MQISGSHPRISDSVGLGSDPRICTSPKFPSDSGAAGPGISPSHLYIYIPPPPPRRLCLQYILGHTLFTQTLGNSCILGIV